MRTATEAKNSRSALEELDIVDTPPEESFDRITRLIKQIFDAEIASISFIEGERQWFKSLQGIDLSELQLEASFCRATWREKKPVVIPDAILDEEFRDHPLVTEAPHLRAYAGVPIVTGDGIPIGTMCIIDSAPRLFTDRDVRILQEFAQIVMTELDLRRAASIDGLTGLFNRRFFNEQSGRMFNLARRKEFSLSLIAFDIDHFKRINDTFGHAAGDEVLVGIAGACRMNLRESDLIGRLGGEEFAITVEGSTEKAVAIAERLREAIASMSFEFDSQRLGVTASFGITTYQPGEDITQLLQRADTALYQAKREGRNRCVADQRNH